MFFLSSCLVVLFFAWLGLVTSVLYYNDTVPANHYKKTKSLLRQMGENVKKMFIHDNTPFFEGEDEVSNYKTNIRRRLHNMKENVKKIFDPEKTTNASYSGEYDDPSQAPQRNSLFGKIRKRFADIFNKGSNRQIAPPIDDWSNMPTQPPRGWVQAQLGEIPPRAFVGGYNDLQKKLFVARANPRTWSSFSIGFLIEGDICARIVVGGYSHCYRKYQVLVGDGYKWMDNYKLEPHPDAILGDDSKSYYVCRIQATAQNVISIGFVEKGYNCRFGARGIGYASKRFELLIDVWVE